MSWDRICSRPRAVEGTGAETHHTVVFIKGANVPFDNKSVASRHAQQKRHSVKGDISGY